MSEVTLTSAMRATLYSLQQTAQLMGTTQSRLSSGKKVNSALDNPNNYFVAQALTDRASDIGSLLDGMSQGIQTIKTATQGIESAQEMVDQMKAIANLALQSSTGSSEGATTDLAYTGQLDSDAVITSTSNTQLLTNLKNNSTDAGLSIAVGHTLTVSDSTTTSTFTVTETSTVDDLNDFLDGVQAGTVTGVTMETLATGAITLVAVGATAEIGGNLATALGLQGDMTEVATGTVETGTVAAATGPTLLADLASANTQDAEDTIALTSLVDANGDSLGIAIGSTLTLKQGDTGQTVTFTVGGDNSSITTPSVATDQNGGGMTLSDLETWMEKQGDATDDYELLITSGKIAVFTDNGSTLTSTIGGDLAEALGINGNVADGATVTATNATYSLTGYGADVATGDTLLRDVTDYSGKLITDGQTQLGDYLSVNTSTGRTAIQITDGMTVNQLMTKINAIDDNLTVTLDSNGQFVIDNQTAGTVNFYKGSTGTTDSKLFVNTDASTDFATNSAGSEVTSSRVLYAGTEDAGTGSAGSSTIDATKKAQFDSALTSLDALIQDTDYQGVNLISGTENSPLTITFNEKAIGASKLMIDSVDLTSTGLGVNMASGDGTGAWTSEEAVRSTLAALTEAAGTLRSQAATFGYNLTTVQNRQDFANNIISTLKEGADMLTLADMNEEGANMLALQTRSQLGTQSLSLASQANQAVMRLFS